MSLDLRNYTYPHGTVELYDILKEDVIKLYIGYFMVCLKLNFVLHNK
jgi:hypothetical protein